MKISTMMLSSMIFLASSHPVISSQVKDENKQPTPTQLLDALRGQPGLRASHPKGFFAEGTFLPDKNVSQFIKGNFFQHDTLPAVFRFSIGGNNPKVSDKSQIVRGLSVHISDDSEHYNLVLSSEPVFFASTPRSVLSFQNARAPDPITHQVDPKKMTLHLKKYPEAQTLLTLLASHPAPSSYATSRYYSNHAFGFKGENNTLTWARIILRPRADVHYLTKEQEKTLPDNFLEHEMKQRLSKGDIVFDVYAQRAEKKDSLSDPSQLWKGKNEVKLGELHVNKISKPGLYDTLVFFPLQLPKNIQGADDPILNIRGAVYRESFSRRKP
ncbi:MAG: catalase [Legionellaceae bacterium]